MAQSAARLLPPLPPGATLDPEPRPATPTPRARPRRTNEDRAPLSLDTITRTVDGDTLGLASGNTLRLWGADAPELR